MPYETSDAPNYEDYLSDDQADPFDVPLESNPIPNTSSAPSFDAILSLLEDNSRELRATTELVAATLKSQESTQRAQANFHRSFLRFQTDIHELVRHLSIQGGRTKQDPSSLPHLDANAPAHQNPAVPSSICTSGLSFHSAPPVADPDEASVSSARSTRSHVTTTSVHDVMKELFHVNQDKSIKFATLTNDTVQKPHLLRDWVDRATNLIRSKPFYAVLLKSDGSFVNPPSPSEDKELSAQLFSVFPDSLKAMLRCTAQYRDSGTQVLTYLRSLARPAHLNSQQIDSLYKSFIDLRWDVRKQSLLEFTSSFAAAIDTLEDTPHAVSDSNKVARWIASMPGTYFDKIQFQYNQDRSLPIGWKPSMNVFELYQATNSFIQAHHPLLLRQSDDKKDKEDIFYPFPKSFENRKAYITHALSKVGTPDFDSLKTAIPTDICPICLFKKNAQRYHVLADCAAYKKKLNSNTANNNSNNTVTNYSVNSFVAHVAPTPTPVTLLSPLRQITIHPELQLDYTHPNTICFFDSGAKHHFICDKSFFSDYMPLPDGKFSVLLGDNQTSLPVAGHGIADIIISKFNLRIRIAAYHVPQLPSNFFSSIEHLQFEKCQAIGFGNKYIIVFPHGSFTVHSCDDYAFNISPAKDSSLRPSFDLSTATICPSPSKSDSATHYNLNRMLTRSRTKSTNLPTIPESTENTTTNATNDSPLPRLSIDTTPVSSSNVTSDLISIDSDRLPDSNWTHIPISQNHTLPTNTPNKTTFATTNPFSPLSQIADSTYDHLPTSDPVILEPTPAFVPIISQDDQSIHSSSTFDDYDHLYEFEDSDDEFDDSDDDTSTSQISISDLSASSLATPDLTHKIDDLSSDNSSATSDTSDISSVASIDFSTDDTVKRTNVTSPIIPNIHLVTDHPCDVLKYLDGAHDDDSHKASFHPKPRTHTKLSRNIRKSTNTKPSNQIPQSSPLKDFHSALYPIIEQIPNHKRIKPIKDLETHFLTEILHALIYPIIPEDPQYKPMLRKAITQLHPAEYKIIHLVAVDTHRRQLLLKNTLPSDPSTYDTRPLASIVESIPSLSTSHNTLPSSDATFQPLSFVPPPILPIDRVNSTVPANVTFTTEHLQRCTGFRNIHQILDQINEVKSSTVTIADIGKDPLKSRGEVATLRKKRRNTHPVTRPDHCGDVLHMDIGFGQGTALGGIRYCLFFVDRKSRKRFIFPLKDLSEDTLLSQFQMLVRDLGRFPKKLISDRDFKLIGSKIEKYFQHRTILTGAPRNRQNQNGLAEIHWKYSCDIARNYLAEKLLPNKFWYSSLEYAVQVSNYLPIKREDGSITTPHFEFYGIKPDYRKLIPLFSTAYVKNNYSTDTTNKFESQTIPAILIGNDRYSDGQLFYNPATDSIISSADYTLDTSHPSGPMFNQLYDGGLQFFLYDSASHYNRAPKFTPQTKCTICKSHPDFPNTQVTVIHIPSTSTPNYTVLEESSNTIIEIEERYLTPSLPPSTTIVNPILSIPWIQHNSKCTLYLPDKWLQPKQGHLKLSNSSWHFLPGRDPESTKHKPIPLPSFATQADSMLQRCELAHGWIRHDKFMENYNARKTQTYLLRRIALHEHSTPLTDAPRSISRLTRISAKNLHSLDPPKTLKSLSKFHPQDREIWNEAYLEEYLGLHETTHTWDYINEDQYQALKKEVGKAIPTMVVSKIKYDENGSPDRVKCRIVVLGHLDPTNWSSTDCFAPVLSSLENRILDALAVHLNVVPKTGDFTQAFCQSYLPPDEKVVVLPPKDCPITPPNTYLLLRRTLYGLKRSPRHWYETAKKTFISLGLNPLPNAPCIFTGTLIEGQPPIYIGLYVDDFKYFSLSAAVEQKLETLINESTSLHVTFEGPIKHFLGIKYTHSFDENGNLTLHLSQTAAIDEILTDLKYDQPEVASVATPYRSGHPVDSIPSKDMPLHDKERLINQLQKLTGSYNWLSTQTRPDIATITSILAAYNSNPSPGHIDAAKYVARYLKGTKDMGISFSHNNKSKLESFVKYPVNPSELLPMTDANWGPQDATTPKPNSPPEHLDLWKTRSISGFVIWLYGPLHWKSKRQTITARSSAEAEIYAIDECTKSLLHILNILSDLNFAHIFTNGPIPIKNDNAAAVQWAYNMTSKGIRHIQIRENAVRESVDSGIILPQHQSGDTNPSDIMTKEDKSTPHFISIRDVLMSKPLILFPSSHTPSASTNASVEGGVISHVQLG